MTELMYFLGISTYKEIQAKSWTIALAVLTIYVVDFAINAGWCSVRTEQTGRTADEELVQSSCRSLIVDTLPIAKQQLGSAWGMRCFPAFKSIPILRSQSKQDDRCWPSNRVWCRNLGPCRHLRTCFGGFSVQAIDRDRCLCFSCCHNHHVLGCRRASSDFSTVVPNHSNRRCDLASNHICRDDGAKAGAVKMISKILKTTMHLPDRIEAICWVQFWAWIGRKLTSFATNSRTYIDRLVPFPLLLYHLGR